MYERSLRPDELMHFGILGMHWGIRRYQNPDGTLTPEGKRRIAGVDYNESTKSARATKRSLNYLSKQKAKMEANANSANLRADKMKGTETGKFYAGTGKQYMARSKEIDSMMKRTINAARSKGQNPYVNKTVEHFVSTGKQKAARALAAYTFGIPGYIITDAVQKNMYSERKVMRNKYKVS